MNEPLREHLATLRLAHHQRADMRIATPKLCGDCGVSWSTSNACQWCGGHAEAYRPRPKPVEVDRLAEYLSVATERT
jgi:hypothetical protein